MPPKSPVRSVLDTQTIIGPGNYSLISASEFYKIKAEKEMLSKFVCSILRNAEKSDNTTDVLFDVIPWQEVGISRTDLELWWKKHKIEDEIRMKREEEIRKVEAIKSSAIAKLTEEEKAALGLKG